MADPLSVLGAAVGVASLTIQIVDGCIKCEREPLSILKTNERQGIITRLLVSTAMEMPEDRRFLKLQVQWEQHRFFRFCLEANLLYGNNSSTETIMNDSSLLLSTLREIELRFVEFDKASKSYRQEITNINGSTISYEARSINILDLLASDDSSHPEDKQLPSIVQEPDSLYDLTTISTASKLDSGKRSSRARRVYTTLQQARRDFRDVVLQPQRWRWVAFDKVKFEKLISQLATLNTRLEGLLDKAWKQQIKDSVDNLHKKIENLNIEQTNVPASSDLASSQAIVRDKADAEVFVSPKISNPVVVLPFSRDSDFTGRETILASLLQERRRPHYQSRRALLGTGGVGKSQIAIEYLYRLQETDPQHLFWIYAGNTARFEQGYRDIAHYAKILMPDESELVESVYRWLSDEANGPWTIILDNVDDEKVFAQSYGKLAGKTLQDFIPTASHGSILVTSRNRMASTNLVSNGTILEVEPMTMQEALGLLHTRLNYEDEETAKQLVDTLDRLPLAITHAGAFITLRKATMSISKYMEYFRNARSRMRLLENADIIDPRRDSSSSKTVAATWQISFDSIRERNPRAADLLALMSMFDSHKIPRHLLMVEDELDLDFDDAIEGLLDHSLISLETHEVYKMHRLVQLSMSQWLSRESQLLLWEWKATVILANKFSQGDSTEASQYQQLLPHAEKVILFETDDFEAKVMLLCGMGRCFTAIWDIHNALKVYKLAVKLSTEHFEPSHFLTLHANTHYGAALHRNSNLIEAEEILRRTVDLYALQGIITNDSNDARLALGLLYTVQYRLTEAEEILTKLVDDAKRIVGPSHKATLWFMNSLGMCIYKQGRLKESEDIYRDIVDAYMKMCGLENPLTLICMGTLATVLLAEGKATISLEMLYQVYEAEKKLFGRDHVKTLASKREIASSLIALGRGEEGEVLLWEVLESYTQYWGRGHLQSVYTLGRIGDSYMKTQRYRQAELLFVEAAMGLRKILGSENSDTKDCIKDLSRSLEAQGKWAEAEHLIRELYNTGVSLKDKADNSYNLARNLSKQDKFLEAKPYLQEALVAYEDVLGIDHEATRATAWATVENLRRTESREAVDDLIQKYGLQDFEERNASEQENASEQADESEQEDVPEQEDIFEEIPMHFREDRHPSF